MSDPPLAICTKGAQSRAQIWKAPAVLNNENLFFHDTKEALTTLRMAVGYSLYWGAFP
jgi:hypothetical protein